VSGGEIAGLIAAGAFTMLVLVLAVPILRLRHTIDAATRTLNEVADRTGPLMGNVHTTVDNVNTALGQVQTSLDGVNLQLERVDTITGHVASVSANVANLTTVVTAAAANPLVKVAAFGYGVKRAANRRKHAHEEEEFRAAFKADQRAAKRARG
jgi:uncharacterized protein YoxC